MLAIPWRRLLSSSPWLRWTVAMHAVLVIVALVLAGSTTGTVTGVSAWAKPGKFAASIAIYVATVAVLLAELPRLRTERMIAAGVCLAMWGETACIWLQAVRGTTSHYNDATAFDGAVFGVMGALITCNTVLAGLLLLLFCVRRVGLPQAVLWGIRSGLAVFLVGSLIGIAMVHNGGHTVGAADGGPGLPVLGWSTRAGDLRVPHALGLHGLQGMPVVGYWASARGRSALWPIGVAAAWLGAVAWTATLALCGVPV